MQDTEERWRNLCAQAATEKDAQKLIELVSEINDLLEAKRLRLQGQKVDNQSPAAPSTSLDFRTD
jgi:hypothetical protein